MEEAKVPEIEDTMIVAYLAYRGHKYEAIMKEGSRVSFRVYGNVDGALREFYEDAHVSINEYLKCLKQVRASMFSKKDEQKLNKFKMKEEE